MKKRNILFLILALSFVPFQFNAQTVYKDVAPILYANCTSCHHPGGAAFTLIGYNNVLSNGGGIANALSNNTMPPWPPDPNYKHYSKERVVSTADKTTLINWVMNGMPAGDTTLAPAPPSYGNYQLFGTPDLILNVPAVTSTATTTDMYYCVNVPVNIPQDRYIRAFEFVPGNPAMIHHAVLTIDTTGTSVDDLSGGCYNFQGQINIGDYAPGMGPTVLPGIPPAKFGIRLKAGSNLSFQLHVPHGTAGQVDQSQLRIYFYPVNETGIRPMLFETALQNWNFVVPANGVITTTAKYPPGNGGLPVAVSAYSCFPHSHQTCTSIICYAYKGTDTIPLIKIPKWDFHWQGQYTFKNLVKIPATYFLYSKHVFDNTTNNPYTPNPNMPVIAGTSTDDEMHFDSFLYSAYQNGDELIDIESMLLNDTLFFPTGLTQFNSLKTIEVYPNPASTHINLQFELATAQVVRLHLRDVWGRLLYDENLGSLSSGQKYKALDISAMQLPAGLYVITLQAGKDRKSVMFTKE